MATSARRINILNPDLVLGELTQIDADYTSGTTVTVISNSGFAADNVIVVGEPTTEKSEAQTVASVSSSTTITTDSALNFEHPSGTPVYRSDFNQVEISTSTSGSWSVLETIAIQWDKRKTNYVHIGGTSQHSYRFRFYNSASGNYSEYSPTAAGSGFSDNQVGFMIDTVRRVINDPGRKVVSDEEVIRFFNKAKDIVNARKSNWWFWYYEDEGTITTVASQRKYNLDDISSSIEYVEGIRLRDTSDGDDVVYPLELLDKLDMDDISRDYDSPETDDSLRYYDLLESDSSSTAGYFRTWPLAENTGNGSFYIRYYQPDDDFSDVSDTTKIPIPSLLEDYAIYRCLQIKRDDQRALVYRDLFYGPSDKRKGFGELSGIALLERMHINKLTPTGIPKSLKRFKGRLYHRRVMGNPRTSTNRDMLVEKYW